MDTLLTLGDVARRVGVGYKTIRNYHYMAELRRREHAPRPGDMPPPDATYGRTPVWTPRTIAAWLERRPGRGVGGGRPRKAA